MRDENVWPESDADAGAGNRSSAAGRAVSAGQGARQAPKETAVERTDRIPRVPATGPVPDVETTQAIPRSGDAEATTRVSWPGADATGAAETTQVHQPIAEQTRWQAFAAQPGGAAPTERIDQPRRDAHTEFLGNHPAEQPPAGEPPERQPRKRRRKPLLIGATVVGVFAVLYVGDLLLTSGRVPRGVTVADVAVGGMSQEAAEDKLRAALQPRLTRPVQLAAGRKQAELQPESSGLDLDWAGTLEQAGDQPLNPITRLTSFFTTREVGVVSEVDRQTLGTALEDHSGELNGKPREGTIAFRPGEDGAVEPRPVLPQQGQTLKVAESVDVVARDWLRPQAVRLPIDTQPVKTTEQGVRAALESIAKPAVAAPLRVRGDGADATLKPADIAKSLAFVPAERGQLRLKVDNAKVRAAAGPQLAGTEQEGRDAKVEFSGGEPTVIPGKEGRTVSWRKTLKPFADVLATTGDKRQLKAVYTRKAPDVTTKDVDKLGIDEVIGEFTTSGFASDSGENIRQVAEEVDGAIVKPGQTFSLNDYTGPRTAAEGYVDAGIIQDGAPARAVGGGISQFATTLYNATYFAGLEDAGHQEHSYYISRYPAAREATVYQGSDGEIDIAFTNNSDTGVAIQTIWTPGDITVKIWGTKRYRVESIPGQRTNFVPPSTQRGPNGECSPSSGAPGFTTSDTRVLYNVDSGAEVGRNTRNVTYNPQPRIVCR